jgi:hypothetical protein
VEALHIVFLGKELFIIAGQISMGEGVEHNGRKVVNVCAIMQGLGHASQVFSQTQFFRDPSSLVGLWLTIHHPD